MKKYHVFQGDTYYACGGVDDYVKSFKTLEDALDFISNNPSDWYNVSETQEDGSLVRLRNNGTAYHLKWDKP